MKHQMSMFYLLIFENPLVNLLSENNMNYLREENKNQTSSIDYQSILTSEKNLIIELDFGWSSLANFFTSFRVISFHFSGLIFGERQAQLKTYWHPVLFETHPFILIFAQSYEYSQKLVSRYKLPHHQPKTEWT